MSDPTRPPPRPGARRRADVPAKETYDDPTPESSYARGDTVERPAAVTERVRDGDGHDREEPGAEPPKPVGVALAGFFSGMAYVLVLPVLYVWLSDPASIGDLLRVDLVWGLLAIVVPVGLAVVPRTRRFGRYMLLGMLLSAVVVLGVAALVVSVLIFTGA